MRSRRLQILVFGVLALAGAPLVQTSLDAQAPLGPTVHPEVPGSEGELWLVPSAAVRRSRSKSHAGLATGARLYVSGDYKAALKALDGTHSTGAAGEYAQYYRALTRLRLEDWSPARTGLESLLARKPEGALAVNTALALGEVAEAQGDHRRAAAIYQKLAADEGTINEDVLSRLGRAALGAGDRKTAAEAYLRVYYEFALTDAATSGPKHSRDSVT